MLSKKDVGKRRVAGTTRDRAPSHIGGSMIEFLLKIEKSYENETRRGN
jgi:hypothetical protein